MKEIRIHGRGGQGAATAGEILALAAFNEGKYAQSFPYFGPERRGAPVVAFTRIDETPIRVRTDIHHPNCVVVLDPKLVRTINVVEGLMDGGIVVLNSVMDPSQISVRGKPSRIAAVDATAIALDTIGSPITNMAMLGAFSAATGWVGIKAVREAIANRFSKELAEKNVKAAETAYEKTKILELMVT